MRGQKCTFSPLDWHCSMVFWMWLLHPNLNSGRSRTNDDPAIPAIPAIFDMDIEIFVCQDTRVSSVALDVLWTEEHVTSRRACPSPFAARHASEAGVECASATSQVTGRVNAPKYGKQLARKERTARYLSPKYV